MDKLSLIWSHIDDMLKLYAVLALFGSVILYFFIKIVFFNADDGLDTDTITELIVLDII